MIVISILFKSKEQTSISVQIVKIQVLRQTEAKQAITDLPTWVNPFC